MSHIALPVAELKPALIGFGKVLDKNATLPALRTIKVERTKDGWIILTATDLDTFATVRLEQPTDDAPEVLLVPFEELQKTLKACRKEDQILVKRTGEATVSIQYAIGNQVAENKVESCPVEEFPEIPRIEGDAIPLPDPLRESLLQAFDCASTDGTRYILNAAFLDVTEKECQQVVGTNGRHLYSSNSFSLPLNKSLVIRTHPFLKWKEFNHDGEWKIKVSSPAGQDNSTQIQLSTRRWRFITREIEGHYPNWRQVIPEAKEMKTMIDLDPSTVDQVIQIIQRMPCHDLVNFSIGMEVADGKLQLLGRSAGAENWTSVHVPTVNISGAPILVFLNREYLSKALRFGLTRIEMIDAMSPLRFCNAGRQMIIMPIRAEAVPPAPVSEPVSEPNGEGAAESVNSETEPSATASEAAAQPTERTSMVNHTISPDASDGNSPLQQNNVSKIEEALEAIDTLKGLLQDGLTSLKDLSGKLRQIQKEQKSSEREFQSIRSTLRSLQSVKL